ncbi:ZIP zinc/iron transport family [Saitoella complicata NRRL Y-17804]|nr:ZIP zinc/iron transport family [Saitoella complicata NRRL Y-17804]ODQ54435.1 ZIP zinc/iron transport family [Saitoella complicata NRRL Y-17804]
MADAATPQCGGGNEFDGRIGLRIGAIFIILATSTFGTFFPLVAKRFPSLRIPNFIFEFAKYFGSGVIVATAFIHLLTPAFEELGDECLPSAWQQYPYAAAFAMISMFGVFFVELFALRYADIACEKPITDGHSHPHVHEHGQDHGHSHSHSHTPIPLGDTSAHFHHALEHDHHHHHQGDAILPAALDPSTGPIDPVDAEKAAQKDYEAQPVWRESDSTATTVSPFDAQLLGVLILEFGVIFHSAVIGLTLAVTGAEFVTLFVVIVFHQTFEGLGLGARLASVSWPHKSLRPWFLAAGYAITTPIAIAVGLGVRKTYDPNSQTALLVSGILDSTAAGILLYTGLVELLAHEFLFDPVTRGMELKKLLYCITCVICGAALMALLGRWA